MLPFNLEILFYCLFFFLIFESSIMKEPPNFAIQTFPLNKHSSSINCLKKKKASQVFQEKH